MTSPSTLTFCQCESGLWLIQNARDRDRGRYRERDWHNRKQECIPVGCVPSAAVAIPWMVSACRGICLPHPPRAEWQTCVKTLPCRNYVADGNNGSWFRSLSWTSINISTRYHTLHSVPVPVPVPFPCSVTIPLRIHIGWLPCLLNWSHSSNSVIDLLPDAPIIRCNSIISKRTTRLIDKSHRLGF